MAGLANSRADSAEIEEIANSISRDLSNLQFPYGNFDGISNSCQIHRVHQLVRELDRFAFHPFVLSIGPYHHKTPSLQFMERMKWWSLDYVLKLNCKKGLRDYLDAIGKIENKVRACYSGEINLDNKSFRRMLLLDGCFLLVYFNGTHEVSRLTKAAPSSSQIPDDTTPEISYVSQQENRNQVNSPSQKQDTVQMVDLGPADVVQWYDTFAHLDVFLLENQIPFFVIQKIYEVLVGPGMDSIVTENIAEYIDDNLQLYTKSVSQFDRPKDFCHLLHLSHMHFRPCMIPEETNHVRPKFGGRFVDIFCKLFNCCCHGEDGQNSRVNQQPSYLQSEHLSRWRRATQYHEAGVIFKRRELNGEKTHSLLDVRFDDGVLEIPYMPIDDRIGSLFRNLIAFEQSNPEFGNYVTAYAIFMSQLISRTDDVTLLSQKGIIVHHLHSDKVVSALFNRLTKGVVFDFFGNFYLKSICLRMETYYQNRTNRWIAWLKHNHLSNPWLGLALLAGLLVLFCTILQTVLTVLAYVGPP